MSMTFLILTVLFIVVSAILVLIVLVQRPQGGGLAGAFGGAGGGSTDTVFGGRVGDALTAMTVAAFLAYVLLAIVLNIMDPSPSAVAATPNASTQPAATAPASGTTSSSTTPTDAGVDSVIPVTPATPEGDGDGAPVTPAATQP